MKSWVKLGLVFFLSFGVRFIITVLSPERNVWIDLFIYMDGGQLIANGVNPYDFNDSPSIRDSLRNDNVAFDPHTSQSQDRWNFYASGNLPLSLLYYGAIEQIAQGDAFIYRVAFALMDSILAVVLAMFIFNFWITSKKYQFLVAAGLGVLSPYLLSAGTFLAEDKGVQILLMVAALYFSKKKSFFLATLFLGWSVAFKGLGAFIAPACLYFYLGEPERNKILNAITIKRTVLFTLAAVIFALQPFIFYITDVWGMMQARLGQNLVADAPQHSSIWLLPYAMFPDSWQKIKFIFTLFFISVNIVGIWRGKLGVDVVTASLLIWFTIIAMLSGSVDRLNIAMTVGILLLGASHLKAGILLSTYYVFAGSMSFAYVILVFVGRYALPGGWGTDTIASPSCLGFVIVYTIMITYYAFKDYHFRWSSKG